MNLVKIAFVFLVFSRKCAVGQKYPLCLDYKDCGGKCPHGYTTAFDDNGCEYCYCDVKTVKQPVEKGLQISEADEYATWGEWSDFEDCNVACGFGFSFRYRKCSYENQRACPGSSFEHTGCYSGSCDGNNKSWTEWSDFSACTQPCGTGTKYQIRQCQFENEEGVMGEDDCIGETLNQESCIEQQCPLYIGGECYDPEDPDGYRGNVRTPIGANKCFSWDHSASAFRPGKYPNSGLKKKLCRNPSLDEGGPWCYTNKKRKRIRYCDVPFCPTVEDVYWDPWSEWSTCSVSCGGGRQHHVRTCNGGRVTQGGCQGDVVESQDCSTEDCPEPPAPTAGPDDCAILHNSTEYRGIINRTLDGVSCQRWDEQFPHAHDYTTIRFPDGDLVENYCRNPDNDKWPWCMTSDANQYWNYCDVPECPPENVITEPGCFIPGHAELYRGSIATTKSEHECQYWDANVPHAHTYKAYQYPSKGLGHHNYCRSPDDDVMPWCISTRPGYFWEYCNVPICEGSTTEPQTTQEPGLTTTLSPETRPPGQECGYPAFPIIPEPTTANDGRIIGGFDSRKGSLPWQIALRRASTNGGLCGGSIIDRSWILTAAHCMIYGEIPSAYTGLAGSYLSDAVDPEEIRLEFDEVHKHESYDPNTLANDIALMKLKNPLTFNDYIKSVCLPATSSVDDFTIGERVLVSGWGTINAGQTVTPSKLQQVYVPLVSRDACNAAYSSQGPLHPGMFCAGFLDTGMKDSCSGDSGGPLVSLRNYEQLGVVSWGIGCALPGRPGVYTYVPYYVDWIKKKMEI